MAEEVYRKAADHYIDDKDLSEFLRQLAEEEALHSRIIGKVIEVINRSEDSYTSLISLDDDSRHTIELPFMECKRRMDEGTISKEDLLECIVSSEFSEWNDIFTYVAESFIEHSREFIPVAAKIQQHKRNIERFAESRPEFQAIFERIRQLPAVWNENLLVVDDSKPIAMLLSAILADEGTVEEAFNGEKALEKLGQKYYAVIITDVEMPVMNGIEFYRRAYALYPNIRERILFYTSSDDTENLSFFRENGLKYLIKPAEIKEIKKTIGKMLNR